MGNWVIVTTNTQDGMDLMSGYSNATLVYTGTNSLVWWWDQAADADVASVQSAQACWASVSAA